MLLVNEKMQVISDENGINSLMLGGQEIIFSSNGSSLHKGISPIFPYVTAAERMLYLDNEAKIRLREEFLREYFFNFIIEGEIKLLENQLDLTLEMGREDELMQGFPIRPGFFLSFRQGLVGGLDRYCESVSGEMQKIPFKNLDLKINGSPLKIVFSGDFNPKVSEIQIRNNNGGIEIVPILMKRYLNRGDRINIGMSLIFE